MAEQPKKDALAQPQLKQRIEVEWDDQTYYGALVQNYRLNDEGSYEWFLKYDDGDAEWLTFDGTVRWRRRNHPRLMTRSVTTTCTRSMPCSSQQWCVAKPTRKAPDTAVTTLTIFAPRGR